MINDRKENIQSFDSASNDVLTASDNSIGSSGGTTEVKMSVHSRNNLYLFLFGSLVPRLIKKYNIISQTDYKSKFKQMFNAGPRKKHLFGF